MGFPRVREQKKEMERTESFSLCLLVFFPIIVSYANNSQYYNCDLNKLNSHTPVSPSLSHLMSLTKSALLVGMAHDPLCPCQSKIHKREINGGEKERQQQS